MIKVFPPVSRNAADDLYPINNLICERVDHNKPTFSDFRTLILLDAVRREGLRTKVYSDPSGPKAIGVGHLIRKGEKFNSISVETAIKLLKADMQRKYDKAIKRLPNHSSNQRWVWTSLAFNCGSGRVIGTNLEKDMINKRDIPSIKNWCKYRNSSGRLVVSSNLRKSRELEYDLYNYSNIYTRIRELKQFINKKYKTDAALIIKAIIHQ